MFCLQVPLSLWAAWGIYSEPGRYRSLFPHNEARKQAVASKNQNSELTITVLCISVLLLTVLFFLPFFQLWVSVKILLLVGVLYAFLFVPLLVGLVKHNLTEQQIVISRVKWNIR